MSNLVSRFYGLLIALALSAFAFSCAGEPEPVSTADVSVSQPGEIRVSIAGMITPKDTFSQYSRLLDYIAEKTGHPTVLVQTGSYMGVNDILAREQVDLAFLCSGGYAEAAHHLGIKPLVAPVVDGQPLYYSYILARSDSGITRFEDFRGRRFAFSDPMSLSGTLYPTYRTVSLGSHLSDFFSNYIFTYNHDNSIKALKEGLVDGTAVDSNVFNYMKKNNPSSIEGLSVIEVSPPFGSPPVVTRRGLPADMREQLLKVLVEMDQNPEGKEILSQLGIERFIAVNESLYDSVQLLESGLITHR